ncbi:MAG: NCS2 family permease [Candidatus Obscuribacterales bacterium]|nr:NCS2 family permease [Candidatus Obscuribacterales bacterium]
MKPYFSIEELGTTWKTEFFAGLSTYLSLAYIFVVNPAILSQAGISPGAVLFATAIASGLSTIFMGLWARLPFAVAPGLEMNGFFAFAVVGHLGLSWPQALGTVFWSGVLCLLFTWLPVRQKIIDSIPDGLKTSIAVSVGVFVATIGLYLAKVIVFKNGLPDLSHWQMTQLVSNEARVMYTGLIVAALLGLKRFNLRGGLLIAMIAATILCRQLGIVPKLPVSLSNEMFSALGKLDIFGVLGNPKALSAVLIFFIVDFYGGIGKFIGLTGATNLQTQGKVRNIEKALYVDGAGTIGGAILGTSSLIAFVESAVGIAAGGRTGMTAVVCGLFMLASLAFTPLVGMVPVEATSGILLYVGWLLLPRKESSSLSRFDVSIALIMAALSFLTFGLDKAMLVGFWAYALKQLIQNKGRVNPYLLTAALLLTLTAIMQNQWT